MRSGVVFLLLAIASSAYAIQYCANTPYGTAPASLPTTLTLNQLNPRFSTLSCTQAEFFPQQAQGDYTVAYNVTDPCNGQPTMGTTVVSVKCGHPVPATNITTAVVWNVGNLPNVVIVGGKATCIYASRGFWYVLSAPAGSAYTVGQLLNSGTGNEITVNIVLTSLGPYVFQFAVFDNCAVYTRNMTIVWDGSLPHLLPPTSTTNFGACDGLNNPIRIQGSPTKTVTWNSASLSFSGGAFSVVPTVEYGSGDEIYTYKWRINATDGRLTRAYPSVAPSTWYYVVDDIPIDPSTTYVSNTSTSVLKINDPVLDQPTGPLYITKKIVTGSPGTGLWSGTITRPGYEVRSRTLTTTTTTTYINNKYYAGYTPSKAGACVLQATYATTNGYQVSLAATLAGVTLLTTPVTQRWPYLEIGYNCTGNYLLSVTGTDLNNCTQTDYDWAVLDCGPAPTVLLEPCDATTVNYNYQVRQFQFNGDANILDASKSTHMFDTAELTCCYQVSSAPSNSQLTGLTTCGYCNWASRTPFTNYAPVLDAAGSYSVTLIASTLCRSSRLTNTYTAVCASYTLSAAFTPGTTSLSFDPATTGIFTPVSTTLTDGSSSSVTSATQPGYITYFYSYTATTTATVPAWYPTATYPYAYFSNPTAVSPVFTAELAGTYTVQQNITIGCQMYQTATQTITLACASSLVPTITPTPSATTDDACGTNTWTGITLTSGYTLTPTYTPAVGQLKYHWELISKPAASAAVDPYAGFTAPAAWLFTPDAPGSYTWRLWIYDNCNLVSVDQTITATQEIPSISTTITTVPSSGFQANTTIQLSTGTTGVIYFWNITQYPFGTVPGPNAVLTGATTATPSLVVLHPGTYVVSLVVVTTCGTGYASVSLATTCPFPLTASALATVSGSGVAGVSSLNVSYINGRFPEISISALSSTWGARDMWFFTKDWIVTQAPVDSIYQPITNNTWVPDQYTDTPIFNNLTMRVTTSRMYTTVIQAHLQPTTDEPMDVCFQPDLPGTYVIQFQLSDGCQLSTATVTIVAKCSAAAPVARIVRKNSLPDLGGSTEIGSSTDGSLRSTQPPSSHDRVVLDATSSTSSASPNVGYYWQWLSPDTYMGSQFAGTSTGIDPQYGAKVVLSGPYPPNATLALWVSDGCSVSMAKTRFGCNGQVNPSLGAVSSTSIVDPAYVVAPSFILNTQCYLQEDTNWHVIAYKAKPIDYTTVSQTATSSASQSTLSESTKLGLGLGLGLFLPLLL